MTDLALSSNKIKIGLALGSGSARGWAHIGVIQELQKHGLEIDIVTGASVGSLVGAAYAAGKLEALSDWVKSLRMRDVVRFMDFSFKSGFVDADRLFSFFRDQFGAVLIEDLHHQYGTLATQLTSGREVWFTKGPLINAIRASSALPGLFSPVPHDNGDYLVDGGLVNPVPVSLARALGADIVIAVNLNTEIVGKRIQRQVMVADPPPIIESEEGEPDTEFNFMAKLSELFAAQGKETLPGFMEVMSASINIMQDRITRSRLAGDPAEILIAPRLAHFGMMEFNRAAEAIEEGAAAVDRVLPVLRSYHLCDVEQVAPEEEVPKSPDA